MLENKLIYVGLLSLGLASCTYHPNRYDPDLGQFKNHTLVCPKPEEPKFLPGN